MRKRNRIACMLLAGMMVVSTFAGCGAQTEGTSQTTEQTAAAPEEEAAAEPAKETGGTAEQTGSQPMDPSGMKPWMNTNVIGMVTEETTATEKDDYYLAVNHDWLMNTKLKDGKDNQMSWDADEIVKDRCLEFLNDKELRNAKDAQLARDAKNIQNLYELFNDWEQRDKAGVEPCRSRVDKLMAVQSISELNDYIADPENILWDCSPVNVSLGIDATDSSLYNVSITVHPFPSYSDSAEYEHETENGKREKEYHDAAFSYMMKRLGYTDEETKKYLDDSFSYEKQLAGSVMTVMESMDKDALKQQMNPVTIEELKEMAPNYPVVEKMKALGFENAERINVDEPKAIKKINELYTPEHFDEIKAYVLKGLVTSFIDIIDKDAYVTNYKLVCKMNGIEETEPDFSEDAYDTTRRILGNSFDRLYKEKYLTKEMKQDITQMCEDAIAVYRQMLSETDWLSEETRAAAINKLDNITIHAVYPEKWEDENGFELASKEEGNNYFDGYCDVLNNLIKMQQKKVNAKVDPEIWGVSILDCNAYYNPSNNSINIIPGLFCDATYNSDMSIEQKYGAIGTIIGHEISHAFDTVGSQYDEKGNIRNWWTDEDRQAFTDRNEKLIKYYDAVVAFDDGTPYSGQLVQTEAVADMAGMKCMLKMAEKEENFDYDKFFRAYAYLWARVATKENQERLTLTDSHPLHYLRCNVTLQQFDEFLKTYDVKSGDGMYLAPEDRILVW